MPETQKRFPYRLLVCSVVLVILAAAIGLIETVGRRGTIVGRYERLRAPTYLQTLAGGADMEGFDLNMSESEVLAVLGPYTDCRDEPTGWEPPRRNAETTRNRFGVLPPEPQLKSTEEYFTVPTGVMPARLMRWEEGPGEVTVVSHRVYGHCFLDYKDLRLTSDRLTWWHVRRWAEIVWTAIHGPRS